MAHNYITSGVFDEVQFLLKHFHSTLSRIMRILYVFYGLFINDIFSDERFVYPTMPKFFCQLYSPTSWELVPNTK